MGIQIVTLLDFDFQYARHDLDNIQIQWGSEIWTSFKCSKKGWLANGPDFEWNLEPTKMVAILKCGDLNNEHFNN